MSEEAILEMVKLLTNAAMLQANALDRIANAFEAREKNLDELIARLIPMAENALRPYAPKNVYVCKCGHNAEYHTGHGVGQCSFAIAFNPRESVCPCLEFVPALSH